MGNVGTGRMTGIRLTLMRNRSGVVKTVSASEKNGNSALGGKFECGGLTGSGFGPEFKLTWASATDDDLTTR